MCNKKQCFRNFTLRFITHYVISLCAWIEVSREKEIYDQTCTKILIVQQPLCIIRLRSPYMYGLNQANESGNTGNIINITTTTNNNINNNNKCICTFFILHINLCMLSRAYLICTNFHIYTCVCVYKKKEEKKLSFQFVSFSSSHSLSSRHT